MVSRIKIKSSVISMMVVVLISLELSSCNKQFTPQVQSTLTTGNTPLITSSPSPSSLDITISPIATAFPSATIGNSVKISPGTDLVSFESKQSIPLGESTALEVLMDGNYFYVIGNVKGLNLKTDSTYRFPIEGGKPEKIAYTRYPGGRINLLVPIVSGDWVIFSDTPDSGNPNTWTIRAVNPNEHAERTIIEVKNDTQNTAMSFNYTAEGNILFWSMMVHSQNLSDFDDCISRMDLNTGQTARLSCTPVNGWIWSILQVSAGRMIAEKDFDENHGAGSDIYIFDPTNASPQELSSDGRSSMPSFSYPWVAWKAGPRYQWMQTLHIHNLQTGESRSITLPGEYNSDPQINGNYVYWSGAIDNTGMVNAIYILDISKNLIYMQTFPEKSAIFPFVSILGKRVAWLRTLTDTGGLPVSFLEWAIVK